MYTRMNEDAAFERLKDMQREVENSRLMAASLPGIGTLARSLGAGAWRAVALMVRRAIVAEHAGDDVAARDAA
jgi:hypothetical protein